MKSLFIFLFAISLCLYFTSCGDNPVQPDSHKQLKAGVPAYNVTVAYFEKQPDYYTFNTMTYAPLLDSKNLAYFFAFYRGDSLIANIQNDSTIQSINITPYQP